MESAPQLSTPEEEIAYLRAQILQKEREIAQAGGAPGEQSREALVAEALATHHAVLGENVLAPEYRLSSETVKTEAEAILEELALGTGASAVRQLEVALEEKGIKNALAVMEKMDDPHITDDFHRYLVRYVAAGLPIADFSEKEPRFRALPT